MEENWDTELDDKSTYTPNFSGLETSSIDNAENVHPNDNFNNESYGSESSFGKQGGFRQEDGQQRGFGGRGGFRQEDGQQRGFGSRGGFRQENGQQRGFGDKGFRQEGGQQKDFGGRGGFRQEDGQQQRGFGGRGGFRQEDGQQRGFGNRGGFKQDDGQQRGFGERGGFKQDGQQRGFGGRGGFNQDGEQQRGFGDRGGEEDGQQRGFGGRGGFRQENRRGFGGRGGGYKGKNEEIGVESTRGHEEETEEGGGQVKKVTYIPPPPPETEDEVFRHYQSGINFDKYDEILVDVKGKDVPPAILTFEEANFCDTLSKNVSRSGYVKLTPVQKHSIPIILSGRDLMACAQTGSGKTAAFLLPILSHMMSTGITASQYKELQEPEALIIAPTRELINQIYLDARKFSYGTCVRPVVVYGGMQPSFAMREVEKGCNILCATPGRLLDIISRGKIGLSQLKYLILDEADRMLDMGFIPDIEKLLSSPGMPSKEDRQTLMFSATYPEDIRRLALKYLKDDHLFVVVGMVGGACSDVRQAIIEIDEFSKRTKLLEILQNTGNDRTMIFVNTKKKADFIAALLCQEKIPSTSIHGDREQFQREAALRDFRTGKCPVIVATAVAARGLDIENVQHVINYDVPKEIDEYVHRIGRTGRCGNVGKATSFFTTKDDSAVARPLVKILSDAHQEVPAWLEEIAFGGASSSYSFNSFSPSEDKKVGYAEQNTAKASMSGAEEGDWE